jgi:DNA-binding MarR family transcriptional regulator
VSPEPTARLLIEVLRRFEADLQERLVRSGYEDVSVAHTNVLRHLDPDGMRLGDLAADARITKQAVTQAVRALEARDLVAVEADPDDRRAKRVVYAPRGRALVACAIEHIRDLEQAWSDTLGAERYHALRAALVELTGPR